jgi:hypothetical protein
VFASAALGPHHAAITALDGKVEAVRTAMTASVKLMIQELGAAVEAASSTGSKHTAVGADVRATVAGIQVCHSVPFGRHAHIITTVQRTLPALVQCTGRTASMVTCIKV